MFIDFRTLPEGSRVEADLCIIGAGAAGITIAREFNGRGIQVCLLESGGIEFDDETQALYEGKNVGLPYYDLDTCRLRYFGGTTNHWSGWCRPLSPIDFEARPHVPYSGWPIARSDLDPYYERANEILEIGPYLSGERYLEEYQIRPPEFSRELLQGDCWRFSPPTRFNESYRHELDKSDDVKVLIYANATNIQANSTASAVDHVEVRSLTGVRGLVVAKIFVLACGGVENARLLLLSNGVEAQGLGNRHLLVGRFFMDHPEVQVATVVSDKADDLQELFDYRESPKTGIPGQPCLLASREVQQEKGILNYTAQFSFPGKVWQQQTRGWQRDIYRSWFKGDIPKDYWRLVKSRVVRDLRRLPADAYEYLGYGDAPKSLLNIVGEPAPLPDSRVMLSAERDRLGLSHAILDWRLSELDKRSIVELVKVIGREFGRLNMGRVKMADWLMDEGNTWPADLHGGKHHMGTTRMADDPKNGVVDSNCRMHGIDNLYVAGSSVFPTYGSGAPTLTIVALSLRLAEHLQRRMTQS
jgi:choline dehydrogenase-like flavoprotein